ncbi:MAG: DUF523 and DUF1722 domain-containing protein [Deltaproteobacteria bacterium]|nr:DUF523 and DUF1722 domain-containing protein [Deltaproteobacteria bacterium]
MDTTPIKLGVSTCLLGESVRYDGGHKQDHFLTDTLGQYVDYIPVCPEVECGLPVPREAMRLVGNPESPRLVTIRTGVDLTDQMVKWADRRLAELAEKDLCGFIFKSRSPSSGMERVKVYNDEGMPVKNGRGIFAGMFMDRFPLIPTEEEGRLKDPLLRENFIARIFTLKRWRETTWNRKNRGALVDFHARHKLLLLSHSEKHYREMGRLVAAAKQYSPRDLFAQYEEYLMAALKLKTTMRKNTNVLQHMLGYFKKDLSADEKQEMLNIIEQYKSGLIPLIVPITLFNHYVRKYGQDYLSKQVYLNPHPTDLKLRNHV